MIFFPINWQGFDAISPSNGDASHSKWRQSVLIIELPYLASSTTHLLEYRIYEYFSLRDNHSGQIA
jgi:hypothetical protein